MGGILLCRRRQPQQFVCRKAASGTVPRPDLQQDGPASRRQGARLVKGRGANAAE